MRIQFPNPSDSNKHEASRHLNRTPQPTPWQSATTNRSTGPIHQKGIGKRLTNAPRRRAY